jgi:cell division protein FtsX
MAAPRVDRLWKDSGRRSELDAIEKEFEAALYDALQEDLTHDPATVEQYRHALHDITSVEGLQLQALVFAAATRVKALQTPNRALRTFALLIIVVVLLIGFWIGARFRR